MRIQRNAYNNGRTTSAAAVKALKTCYKNAVAAKTWGNLDITRNDITLLTTKIAAQQKEIAQLKSSSGGGTKLSTKQSGNKKTSNKDNTNNSWMVTFAGTTKKAVNGEAYEIPANPSTDIEDEGFETFSGVLGVRYLPYNTPCILSAIDAGFIE